MILFMKITIFFKIENFLLINFCIKSKVSNKKVLCDSSHMMHKIKKLLYSININLQQVWWTNLVKNLYFSRNSLRASGITFNTKKVKTFCFSGWGQNLIPKNQCQRGITTLRSSGQTGCTLRSHGNL